MSTTTKDGPKVAEEKAAPKAIKKETAAPDKRIERVPLSALSIERAYQRPATSKMEEMGKAWDDRRSQIITLSERDDGSLWIIDGQHRVGAALIAGKDSLQADIFTGLTFEEEALLFDLLNTGRAHVSAIDRFRARLVYKDPEALAIKEIVEEFGGTIAETSKWRDSADETKVRAIAALERVYKNEGPKGLRMVLDTISRGWGGIDAITTNERTLGGTRFMLTRQRKRLDRTRLIDRMHDEGLSSITRMAHAHGQIFGGSGPLNFYRALVEAYNRNMKPSNRLRP